MTKEELDKIQIKSLPNIDTELFILETYKAIDLYESLTDEEVRERIEEIYSRTNLYIDDMIIAIINYNARVLSVYFGLEYVDIINSLLMRTINDICCCNYKNALLTVFRFIIQSTKKY